MGHIWHRGHSLLTASANYFISGSIAQRLTTILPCQNISSHVKSPVSIWNNTCFSINEVIRMSLERYSCKDAGWNTGLSLVIKYRPSQLWSALWWGLGGAARHIPLDRERLICQQADQAREMLPVSAHPAALRPTCSATQQPCPWNPEEPLSPS